MAIARWEPMHELRTLTRRMERALESITGGVSPFERLPFFTAGEEMWPTVDVYEDKEELVVRAELPGTDMKDVEVTIDDSTLTLRGHRKLFKEDRRENYRRIESAYGAFSRSFTMPSNIDADKIRAELKNGVLEVHVPKREGARGKSIPIHT